MEREGLVLPDNEAKRPGDWCKDEELEECLVYLDELKESGVVNMFFATGYLQQHWIDAKHGTGRKPSRGAMNQILKYWMKTYHDRHPD